VLEKFLPAWHDCLLFPDPGTEFLHHFRPCYMLASAALLMYDSVSDHGSHTQAVFALLGMLHRQAHSLVTLDLPLNLWQLLPAAATRCKPHVLQTHGHSRY